MDNTNKLSRFQQPNSYTKLFCAVANEQITKKKIYINFGASSSVDHPEVDINSTDLIREWLNPKFEEDYQVPIVLSPFLQPKEESDKKNSNRITIFQKQSASPDRYIIVALINDKFARRVLVDKIIQHYVILVTLTVIEKVYNKAGELQKGEFIGHDFDFTQDYEILKDRPYMESSGKLVNNKVTLVSPSTSDIIKFDNSPKQSYDLYYRPKSRILTLCMALDKIPDKVSFTEDRIKVNLNACDNVDIWLPFYIDLDRPVRYKYDDKTSLFRFVAQILEESVQKE